MKKILIGTALLAIGLPNSKAAELIRWDQVRASYLSTDRGNDNYTGYSMSVTKLINGGFFITGHYESESDDFNVKVIQDEESHISKMDSEIDSFSVGVGYKHPLFSETDWFGTFTYEKMNIELTVDNQKDEDSYDGYVISTGLRSLFMSNLELTGSIGYETVGSESDPMFNLGASYYLTPQSSLGFGYEKTENTDTISASISWDF